MWSQFTITKWESHRDSKNRVGKLDLPTGREFVINTDRISDLVEIDQSSCKCNFVELPNAPREGKDYMEIAEPLDDIIQQHDTPYTTFLATLPVYRNNNTLKPTTDILINTDQFIYADAYNPLPDDASWVVYERDSFTRVEALVALSLAEILELVSGILRSGDIWYRRETNEAEGYFALHYSSDAGATWEEILRLDLTEDNVIIDPDNLYRHRIVGTSYHVDRTLTPTGYSGTEGIDWENIYAT